MKDSTDSDNVAEYLIEVPSAELRRAWETALQYSQDFVVCFSITHLNNNNVMSKLFLILCLTAVGLLNPRYFTVLPFFLRRRIGSTEGLSPLVSLIL